MKILIVGPTAIGKTALSIAIAQKYNLPIISIDSRQCYKHLDIGTASPTEEELAAVDHYNVSVLEPDEKESVNYFLRRIESYFPNWRADNTDKRTPQYLFVGGSTLNAQAVLQEPDNTPPADADFLASLHERMEKEGLQTLYDELAAIDPAYVQRIDGLNRQRIFRALDVYQQTGKAFSSFHTSNIVEDGIPDDCLVIGLNTDRKLLYDRINKRVELMWEQGFVDEVKALLQMGYHAQTHSLQSVGYAECIAYLQGEISKEYAIERMQAKTRQYAKRQLTWYRRWPFIHWVDPLNEPEKAWTFLSDE